MPAIAGAGPHSNDAQPSQRRRCTTCRSDEGADDSRPLATNRTMEIVVALRAARRLRHRHLRQHAPRLRLARGRGAGARLFPFWVAVILGVSSLVNLVGALRGHGAGEIFCPLRPFGRVLAVLVPSLVYVPDRRPRSAYDIRSASMWPRPSSFSSFMIADRAREPVQGAGRRPRSCPRPVLHVREMVPRAAAQGAARGLARLLSRRRGQLPHAGTSRCPPPGSADSAAYARRARRPHLGCAVAGASSPRRSTITAPAWRPIVQSRPRRLDARSNFGVGTPSWRAKPAT